MAEIRIELACSGDGARYLLLADGEVLVPVDQVRRPLALLASQIRRQLGTVAREHFDDWLARLEEDTRDV